MKNLLSFSPPLSLSVCKSRLKKPLFLILISCLTATHLWPMLRNPRTIESFEKACASGDLDYVIDYSNTHHINDPGTLDQVQSKGLIIASANGKAPIVNFLLSRGARANAQSLDAAYQGSLGRESDTFEKVMMLLLAKDRNQMPSCDPKKVIERFNAQASSYLFEYISKLEHEPLREKLSSYSYEDNQLDDAKNARGETLLMHAIHTASGLNTTTLEPTGEIIRTVLDYGASPKQRSCDQTPLLALLNNHQLRRNIRYNPTDPTFNLINVFTFTRIINNLIEHGAKADESDGCTTVLHQLADWDTVKPLRIVLSLVRIAEENNKKIINGTWNSFLLAKDRKGRTALQKAQEWFSYDQKGYGSKDCKIITEQAQLVVTTLQEYISRFCSCQPESNTNQAALAQETTRSQSSVGQLATALQESSIQDDYPDDSTTTNTQQSPLEDSSNVPHNNELSLQAFQIPSCAIARNFNELTLADFQPVHQEDE